MKKYGGRLLAEIGGGDFVGSSNTGFIGPKCAKARLQASIISIFFRGLYYRTPVNKREGWEGKGEAYANEKRRSEKPETRGTKKVVRFFQRGLEVAPLPRRGGE
jgi:hypothetical protein